MADFEDDNDDFIIHDEDSVQNNKISEDNNLSYISDPEDSLNLEVNLKNKEEEEERDNIDQQARTVLAEFLYNVQKIGKYKDETKTVYVKDEFCELSLKDIHRVLRADDPENPKMRIHFIKWKIVESDIFPLILQYKNNDKIQKLCLAILVDITDELKEICENRDIITSELTILQSKLIQSKLIDHLSNVLIASTEKINLAAELKKELSEEKKKLKQRIVEASKEEMSSDVNIQLAKEQEELDLKTGEIIETEDRYFEMVELIFVFMRNLLNIYNYSNIKTNIENYFAIINKMLNLKFFEGIIHYSKEYKNNFNSKLSLTLLELLYYVVKPINPSNLFICDNPNPENEMTLLKKLREEERLESIQRHSTYSTRPANFGSMYQVKRPLNKTSFITSNLNNLNNDNKINKIKIQKSKPIKKLQRKANQIHSTKFVEEIKFINDQMINENTDVELFSKEIFNGLRVFFINFIDKSFNQFVAHFEKIIHNQDNMLLDKNQDEKYDFYNFSNLISFCMEFFRLVQYKNQDEQRKKYNNKNLSIPFIFNSISSVFSQRLMTSVYNIVSVNSDEKSKRNLFDLYSGLRLIKIYFLLSIDAFKGKSDANMELSISIQDALLVYDYTKIFKNMFILFKDDNYNQSLLLQITELVDIYLTALDLFSKKRSIHIKTKKLRRKTGGKNEGEELDQSLILSDSDSEDKYIIKHREILIEKEVEKIIVDYSVILKILSLLNKNDVVIRPSDKHFHSVKVISSLFKKIVSFNFIWIFYNAEILNIFNDLLNDKVFPVDPQCAVLREQIKSIVKGFFDKFRENKLLLIECLFRFNSQITKDSIFNNYNDMEENYIAEKEYDVASINSDIDNVYDGNIQFEKGEDYIREEEEKRKKKLLQKSTNLNNDWNKEEDLKLIDFYEEYKDLDNFEELALKMFVGKKFKKISERLNTLKIRKGRSKALKTINKIYETEKTKEELEIKRAQKHLKHRLTTIMLEISDECALNDEYKNCLLSCVGSFIEQVKSYYNRIVMVEGNFDATPYFVYVITETSDIKALDNNNLQGFLSNIGLVELKEKINGDQITKWIISPTITTESELEALLIKLTKFRKTIVENLSILSKKHHEEKKQNVDKLLPQFELLKRKKLKKQKKSDSDDEIIKEEEEEDEEEDKQTPKDEQDNEAKRERRKEKKRRKEEKRRLKELKKLEKKNKRQNEEENNDNDGNIIKDIELDESLTDNGYNPIVALNSLKNEGKDIYDNLDKLINFDSPKKSKKRLIRNKALDVDDINFSDI